MCLLNNMILTMSPLILAGIANMIFTKTNIYQKYKTPIDDNLCCKDGRRVFGDNKTWIGFASMVLFCIAFQLICGIICNAKNLNLRNDWYNKYSNTPLFNAFIGFVIGFIYMISELPNSFVKRRLNIDSGKTGTGVVGILFFLIDQIDSLIGVMFILYIVAEISMAKYFMYVFVGGIIHLLVNTTLYLIKVRRNV